MDLWTRGGFLDSQWISGFAMIFWIHDSFWGNSRCVFVFATGFWLNDRFLDSPSRDPKVSFCCSWVYCWSESYGLWIQTSLVPVAIITVGRKNSKVKLPSLKPWVLTVLPEKFRDRGSPPKWPRGWSAISQVAIWMSAHSEISLAYASCRRPLFV